MRTIIYQILIQLIFQQFAFSQKNVTWQIYDQGFNKVTEARAKEISIQNHLIWYNEGKGFGVMDMQGNILIKPKYDKIIHYPGGLTAAGIKGCFSMVYSGKEIIPLQSNSYFQVDSSGYFIANQGCSENENAYIITTPSIHDRSGKIISTGCDDDIRKLFLTITKKDQPKQDSQKRVSNGFVLKLMKPEDRFVRKGIYNSRDSLIYSCSACRISDNINGYFFIYQNLPHPLLGESYVIDTTGAVKIKANYKYLTYNLRHDNYLYQRGNEYGVITKNGTEQFMLRSDNQVEIVPVSENRFLLSVWDPLKSGVTTTICDSTGRYLFAPTKDHFKVTGNNYLIRESSGGYTFVDNVGKPVSDRYDSIYAVPDFNFGKMVLGINYVGVGFGSDVHAFSPLENDGRERNVIKLPINRSYIIEREGKLGLFSVDNNTLVVPEYALIGKVSNDLFAVKKGLQWFILNNEGNLKSFGKNRYINFFENYILVGK